MPDRVRVVLGFDCETDVGSWTPFYEGMKHGLPAVLDALDEQKATATFFFTGDCARKQPDAVHRVLDREHVVGCHSLYHETVGDALFDIPGIYPLLPEEVLNRLRTATDWVSEAAGHRPVSFRAPRLFGSTAMIVALESLGYKTDASYPMYCYRDRIGPYHPSREDWAEEGDLKILELPNFADLSMESRDPFGRDLDQWPLFRTESAAALLRHVDGFIGFCRARKIEPFLCFYFHPWEFHEMPQGEIHYGEGSVRPDPFLVKGCGGYAAAQFGIMLQELRRRGAEFLQARQMADEC